MLSLGLRNRVTTWVKPWESTVGAFFAAFGHASIGPCAFAPCVARTDPLLTTCGRDPAEEDVEPALAAAAGPPGPAVACGRSWALPTGAEIDGEDGAGEDGAIRPAGVARTSVHLEAEVMRRCPLADAERDAGPPPDAPAPPEDRWPRGTPHLKHSGLDPNVVAQPHARHVHIEARERSTLLEAPTLFPAVAELAAWPRRGALPRPPAVLPPPPSRECARCGGRPSLLARSRRSNSQKRRKRR